ncbi:MAG TPA: hypothetical protein VFR95_02170 [Gemmatimonadaceae bacterium]|nr:hypothetical protein [Gemmatimonadaceae bacterium]
MHDRAGLLPEWAAAELRRPIAPAEDLHERIMARIHAEAPAEIRSGASGGAATAPAVPAGITARASRATQPRGHRFAVSGTLVALAASVAWMALTPSILPSGPRLVPALGSGAGRAIVLGDTVDSALHDTLRLVRFVLHAPTAARVAIAGDFNGWSRTATPLMDSAGSGVWEAVVALDRQSARYAFVVDDTQWVEGESVDAGKSANPPLPAAPVGGDST